MDKDTLILFHLNCVLLDEKYWDKPSEFNPNRFLDKHGHYVSSNFADTFVPFSVGRRKCPGEQITHTILLMILARFMQLLMDYNIELAETDITPDLLESDWNSPIVQRPKPYKIKLIKQ